MRSCVQRETRMANTALLDGRNPEFTIYGIVDERSKQYIRVRPKLSGYGLLSV